MIWIFFPYISSIYGSIVFLTSFFRRLQREHFRYTFLLVLVPVVKDFFDFFQEDIDFVVQSFDTFSRHFGKIFHVFVSVVFGFFAINSPIFHFQLNESEIYENPPLAKRTGFIRDGFSFNINSSSVVRIICIFGNFCQAVVSHSSSFCLFIFLLAILVYFFLYLLE